MSSILLKNSILKLKLANIVKFFSIIFLIVWPWQTRYFLFVGANEYLTRSIYLSDLVVILLAILSFPAVAQRRGRESRVYLDNDDNTDNQTQALLTLDSRLHGNDKESVLSLQQILKYFFIGLAPVAILAIAQFTLQTSFSTKWLGLAKHDPAELGQVVIETANGERWLRSYGSFDHPNILGGVMAVALLLLLVNSRKKWDTLENIYTVLFSAALFFSFSRAAWLALVVGLLVFVIASEARQSQVDKSVGGVIRNFLSNLRLPRRVTPRNDKARGNWSFFIIVIILFSLFSFLYSNLICARVSADGRIEQKSINERISYYSEAKELFLAHPYFGVGFRNYVPSLMNLKPGRPVWSYQPVHNSLVLALVELGLVGVILAASFLWLVFRYKIKDKRYKMGAEIFTLLSFIFTLALFDHWLWSFHTGWLFIGLMLAISIKLLEEE